MEEEQDEELEVEEEVVEEELETEGEDKKKGITGYLTMKPRSVMLRELAGGVELPIRVPGQPPIGFPGEMNAPKSLPFRNPESDDGEIV